MTAISPATGIFTIGHSNHSIKCFIELLALHGVDAIADVRSIPYSRWQRQFNREPLKAALKGHGIGYVFLGEELGARTSDPACYENGVVQYGKLAETALFSAGIERVLKGSQKMAVALMCAEKEPLECHRAILVARKLVELGAAVRHIHADGGLESHVDAMERLRGVLKISESGLISMPLEAVYAEQEKKIAYAGKKQQALEARETGNENTDHRIFRL